MTKLEEVLAEEWSTNGPTVHALPVSAARFLGGAYNADCRRAAVAVLGKSALALVLKHEWTGSEVGDVSICAECGARKWPPGGGDEPGPHKPGCAWGAICEEARKIG